MIPFRVNKREYDNTCLVSKRITKICDGHLN